MSAAFDLLCDLPFCRRDSLAAGSRAAPFQVSAQLHGLWTPPSQLTHTARAMRVDGAHARHLEIRGTLTITTLEWTAANLARRQSLAGAMVPIESAIRLGATRLSNADGMSEFRGAQWAVVLAAVNLADGKVESALEAFTRGVLVRLELPMPQAQIELRIDGRRLRPDFAWPEQQVILEVDGEVKYRDQGEIAYERGRQRELEAAGWRVIRVTWAELRESKSPPWGLLRQVPSKQPHPNSSWPSCAGTTWIQPR